MSLISHLHELKDDPVIDAGSTRGADPIKPAALGVDHKPTRRQAGAVQELMQLLNLIVSGDVDWLR
jgi:hypothetical protein